MVSKNGQVRCVAYNGGASSADLKSRSRPGRRRKSKKGVKAVARCCKLPGLNCRYLKAGPSKAKESATVSAKCADDELALGCSSYQPFPVSKGVVPVTKRGRLQNCKAVAGAPINGDRSRSAGANAYAACCSAGSQLSCSVVKSKTSKLKKKSGVRVSCPAGYVMTDCNFIAPSGKPAGVRIYDKKRNKRTTTTCKAFLGADLPQGSTGVQALATCCRFSDDA